MKKFFILQLISVIGAITIGFGIPLVLIGYVQHLYIRNGLSLLASVVAGINIFSYFLRPTKNVKSFSSWINIGLIADLFSLLPLGILFSGLRLIDPAGGLLFNLLIVRHIRRVKNILDSFGQLQPITYRLIPIFITLPLLIHMLACGWIFLGSGTAGRESDKILEYVKSIYWTFTTLTTVGYGDIAAKTIGQMLYTCLVQVTGVGVFGFIVSNVASLLARRDAAREHHMDNLDKIENFMQNHRIPFETRAKVRSYYHYMWKNKKGYRDNSALEDLPKKIQSELYFHINRPVLQQVPFLCGASQELVEDLMNELELMVCVPGEKIFKCGDPGEAMYFIYKGEVEIISKEGVTIAQVKDGSFFGEMALLHDRARSATARANEFCDLYVLKKNFFQQVCRKYPEFFQHIQEVVEKRSA